MWSITEGRLRNVLIWLCKEHLIEFTCITKLIAKITLEIAELPLSIANDVLKAIELVEGLSTSLETCATVQVARASAEGAGILAEITKCVNDKINV